MVSKKCVKESKELVKFQKFFSEIMRALGFVLLFAFSMLGAVIFFFEGNIIQTIVTASVINILLFAMMQVKDRW